MIPNIVSKPARKPFKDVTGIFGVVSHGEYEICVKIPEITGVGVNKATYNVFYLNSGILTYMCDDQMVLEPKNVDIKVEF